MTSNEKRKAVVNAALTRKGKNQYSQDSVKRYMVENGFGDCSSSIRHWFKKILKIDIGLNTEAQIKSKLGKIIDVKITNGVPDESKLKQGDCLFFRGNNDGRFLGVGHIEMYIGNGQLFGHGSGIGGKVSNMKSYCANRQNTASTAKLKNRGLIHVVRFIEDDKATPNIPTLSTPSVPKLTIPKLTKPSKAWVLAVQKELNKTGHRDSSGNKLVEDGLVGLKTKQALVSLKLGDRGELVKLAQQRLNELGFDCGKADGIFGAKAEKSVINLKKAFMGSKNPTSTIGTLTWDVLLGLYVK